ncbi:hypothetical protein [Chishuiella changwenlii]|uniref:hypothetical protein n=1 Tax=Chishuiella changwenlii TaxID=1434701 RepID=UPI002FDA96B2
MKNVKLFSSLFVLFSIFSCTQDDITESTSNSANTPKDYNQQIISFKEFLKAESNNYEVAKLEKYYPFEEVKNYENETSLERKQFKNDSNHEWSIDTTKVSKIATKDLTIYTFAVIEYEPIEGFRNVIVKKQNGITTNHIIHYPEGVDFENHTPRKAIFKDLDSKIQTRSEKGEVCYSVVIDLVYDCASGACKYGWHLEEKPCGAVSGSTSGGSSGSGSGSGPGGSSGNPGGNSNPGDGLGSGGGNYGGSGYGDGNNLPVYPMRGQYTEQAERLSVILQITSIRDKKWLSDNIRISNIMLEILAVDNTYQTKKQSIWLINYFIKNTRAKRHFEQNPKDLEVLYALGIDFFSRNPNISWDYLARIIRIQKVVNRNPYLILKDIPGEEFQHWKNIYEYKVPQLVHDRINELQHTYGNSEKSFYLHDIKNAYGPIVNMDFFPVTIHNFPIKPGTNRPYEAREFFEEVMRINLNTLLKDGPANFNGYSNTDQKNWNRIYANVLSVMMRFDINAGLGIFSQDGSVITIESSPNKWKFATIRTPRDGDHPVSGTREFGYYVDLNGKHVFYTRGIDRITRIDDTFNGDFIGRNFGNGENAAFEGADKLWNTFQKNLVDLITKDGVGKATINQDYISRPDFSQFLKVLKGEAELSTLPNF